MQFVGADWLRCKTREDDLSSRPGSIVQVFSFSFHFLLELESTYHCQNITARNFLSYVLWIFIYSEICSKRWCRILFCYPHTSEYDLIS
jgi:hypothetical protein